MQNHWIINTFYRCKRSEVGDLIQVLNSGAYVLAHYRARTGVTTWQRIVPASDKKTIEDWLGRNFPVPSTPPKEIKLETEPVSRQNRHHAPESRRKVHVRSSQVKTRGR
jgi:hypothetical protein